MSRNDDVERMRSARISSPNIKSCVLSVRPSVGPCVRLSVTFLKVVMMMIVMMVIVIMDGLMVMSRRQRTFLKGLDVLDERHKVDKDVYGSVHSLIIMQNLPHDVVKDCRGVREPEKEAP